MLFDALPGCPTSSGPRQLHRDRIRLFLGPKFMGCGTPVRNPGGKIAVKQVWNQLGERLEELRKHENF